MTKKEPDNLNELFFLHRQIQRLVQEDSDLLRRSTLEWVPLADIYETDSRFVIVIELPGVKRDDIEITVEGQSLKVRGAKKPETTAPSGRYHQVEREYGEFSRQFRFEVPVDPDHIEATVRDGTLTIAVRKKDRPGPLAIEIK